MFGKMYFSPVSWVLEQCMRSFNRFLLMFIEHLLRCKDGKKFYKASAFHQFSVSLYFNCLSPVNSRVLHLLPTQGLRWCQWQEWKMLLAKGFPHLVALPSLWRVPREHITSASLLFIKEARKDSVSGPLYLLFSLPGIFFHRRPLGSGPHFL